MTFQPRHHDPGDVAVQINVRVPFAYRAFLQEMARRRGTSLNRLVLEALVKQYHHDSLARQFDRKTK